LAENEHVDVVFSNARIFYEMASASHANMQSLINAGKRKKPNGEVGHIVTYDPDHKSFKEALSVIVFSGVYLEALLHLLIVKEHSKSVFKKNDKKYEIKLKLLGCNDKQLLAECAHYRTIRREVVHEKAHFDSKKLRVAETEAERAFSFIESLRTFFGERIG
jgi:deoxycytidylate deaminase